MHRGLGTACSAGVLSALLAAAVAAQTRDPGTQHERRVALVVGNADYDQGRLRNPVNDARAIAHALRQAGFEVIAKENADRMAMYEAIVAFGDRLKETKGVGLFYFSGHGLQVQGRNFMIPLQARITTERLVETEAVDVNRVLGEMDAAQARINIVILDACRDNPYARGFRSTARGLAQTDAPRGTLVAYATAPGKVAEDGTGQNSPYTAALVKHLVAPGLPVESIFKRVRIEVLERTGNFQEPWESSSLTGDFYFVPGAVRPMITNVREYGTLAVRGNVAGIGVWLDDQKLGATETGSALVMHNVSAGPHRITARKAGWKEWVRDVHVAANDVTSVGIDMSRERDGIWRGEQGIWRAELQVSGTDVTGNLMCFRRRDSRWTGVLGFSGTLDEAGNFTGAAAIQQGWVPRRLSGRFPTITIEATQPAQLDCPDGAVTLERPR